MRGLVVFGIHLIGETVFFVEIIIPVGVCAFFWFLFLDWGILKKTCHTIQVLDLSKTIDRHFPALGSNCALKASTFINTLVLSQHEGGECLDDVVHIAKDKA
jgi:hypothetical protein